MMYRSAMLLLFLLPTAAVAGTSETSTETWCQKYPDLCPSSSESNYHLKSWTIAVGPDMVHGQGAVYMEGRYFYPRWKHLSVYLGALAHTTDQITRSTLSPRVGVELYETWLSGRIGTGLGLTLAQPDKIVSTSLRYQIRFAFILKNGWSVELLHESNCQSLCDNSLLRLIPHGTNGENLGYNVILVRVPICPAQ